jgi:hypothetical protein
MAILPAILGGLALFNAGKSLFGKKDKNQLPNFFNGSQANPELVNQLSLNNTDVSRMLDDLYRSITTSGALNANRINEVAARENLPVDTQLASLRGNQLATSSSIQQGRSNILNQQAFSRIDAIRSLLNLQNSNQQAQLGRDQADKSALLNALYQAALIYGAGGFKGNAGGSPGNAGGAG